MLYTYGIHNPDFKEVSKEFIFDYFRPKEEVEFDTETNGLDHIDNDVLCFQLGDADNQFVIHVSKLQEFKKFLEKKILIGANIKFDLKFLYKYGIWPRKVFDIMLAETVITNGLDVRRGLAPMALKYCDVKLDKSVRDGIALEGWTTRVVQYSGDDVKLLSIIKKKQLEEAEKQGVLAAIEQENLFVLALAYIEICGFTVSEEAWRKKIKTDEKNLMESMQRLDDYIIKNKMHRYISPQMDLFGGGRAVTINWSSSDQVVELFERLGIPVKVFIKGEMKKTVVAKHIKKYSKKFPIVPIYLEYKELDKVVSTYGENFLKQIRSDGRIYTKFTQLMDTGRTSSGGKEIIGKKIIKRINFQNIPSDKETRHCFTAGPGNKLIISDYSGQEQIILVNESLDENLLDFYDNGLSDMHSFVASKMYIELEGLTVEEIKANHSDKRYNAKTAGFAINYGGVGKTIADNNNLTIEEGNAIYDAYFAAFPGLKAYFDRVKQEGLDKGYILISKLTGRKCYIEDFDAYTQLKSKFNRKFWERWRYLKGVKDNDKYKDEYQKIKDHIARFFKIKGDIERMSLNYPIQGKAGEITKAATVLFFNWIKANNLLGVVMIPNTVHDELVAECPEAMAEDVAKVLQHCMEEAGKPYCQRVPLKAEPKIAFKWDK